MNKTTYISILVLALAIIFLVFYWPFIKSPGIGEQNPVACTMEAKLCPDGSSVGRSGPNCEFSACPGASTATSSENVLNGGDIILAVGQTGTIDNLKITLNKITQDSRCPKDVLCFWAGLVETDVTLVHFDGAIEENVILKSTDKPYIFYGYNVSIVDVQPIKESTRSIKEGDYRVTFHSSLDESQTN
jgi:hypothetical protein